MKMVTEDVLVDKNQREKAILFFLSSSKTNFYGW